MIVSKPDPPSAVLGAGVIKITSTWKEGLVSKTSIYHDCTVLCDCMEEKEKLV